MPIARALPYDPNRPKEQLATQPTINVTTPPVNVATHFHIDQAGIHHVDQPERQPAPLRLTPEREPRSLHNRPRRGRLDRGGPPEMGR